jgi:hypothetical protein
VTALLCLGGTSGKAINAGLIPPDSDGGTTTTAGMKDATNMDREHSPLARKIHQNLVH